MQQQSFYVHIIIIMKHGVLTFVGQIEMTAINIIIAVVVVVVVVIVLVVVVVVIIIITTTTIIIIIN